jgi:hypothetical protein
MFECLNVRMNIDCIDLEHIFLYIYQYFGCHFDKSSQYYMYMTHLRTDMNFITDRHVISYNSEHIMSAYDASFVVYKFNSLSLSYLA